MFVHRRHINVKFEVNSHQSLSVEGSRSDEFCLRLIKCALICSKKIFSRSVNLRSSMMKLAFAASLLIFNFSLNSAIFKTPQDADNENASYKIYDGSAMMQFPYSVKIFSRDTQKTLSGYSCSGSIVHQLWIATAAHCVYGFKVFDVFIGNVTNDVDHVVRATHVFIHPNYTFEPELLNDFALMKLKRSLETLNNSKLTLSSCIICRTWRWWC